jgi:DNA modification methylase
MSTPRDAAPSPVRKFKSSNKRVRITRIGRPQRGDPERSEPLAHGGEAAPSPLPWQIKMVPTNHLRRAHRNVRSHPARQLQYITNSMQQFGPVNPLLVDEDLNIIGGHARAEAAERAGYDKVPCIILAGLSETEKRTLALADNKIAELGGWLRADLATELFEIAPLLEQAGLSIELTGFEPAEFDALMGDLVDPEQEPVEALPPPVDGDPVSRRGDLWACGLHRILCGDATDSKDVHSLMRRERAAMAFTDPPYNVKIKKVQGRGNIQHQNFLQGSGELSPEQFTRFLVASLSLAAKYSVNGSIHFVCMDWRHNRELQAAGDEVYSELKNIVVWVKTNAGMGSFYRSQHELVFVFKHGDASHLNNFELGQHGRSRSNVWSYAGVNSFRAGRLDDLAAHPTVKPVTMVADAMRDCSRRGDVVLDPFLGSGTTVLAAERVGRRGYGLELDPLYVDVTIRRWQTFTKRDAVLKATGQTFDEVAEVRSATPKRRAK